MNAIEYVKTTRRMIANNVPMKSMLGGWTAEDIVKQVEQWAKEHPVKTRQSELLKLFPNTSCYQDDCIDMCPCEVGCLLMEDDDSVCAHNEDGVECGKCKRDFWLKEIE